MATNRALLLAAARRHAKTGTGRDIRKTAGVSLADLGLSIGANKSTVWRWEEGKSLPRGDRAVRWAELLAELAAMNAGADVEQRAA